MNYQNFSLVFGASIWLLATLVFRFWGDVFFLIENTLVLVGLFLGVVPVLYGLAQWVFKRYELKRHQCLESAVLMATPGMVGDVACIQFHPFVFPTLTIEQAIVLGSWLLWAYMLVLMIGLLARSRQTT